jgi:aspartate 1-decarboxylase
VIVFSSGLYEPDEVPRHKPRVVHVDAGNRII